MMHVTFRLVNGEILTADIASKDFKVEGKIVVLSSQTQTYLIPLSSIVYIRQDLEVANDDAGNDS